MGHENAVEHVDILSLHYTHGDIDIPDHENKIPMYDHIYEEYIEPGRLEGVWVSEGGMLGKPWEEAPWAQWVPRYLVPLLYWSIEHDWNDRDKYKHFWYHMAHSGGFEPKKILQQTGEGSLELRPVGEAFKTLTSTLGDSETVGTFPGDVSVRYDEAVEAGDGSKSATVVDAETPTEAVSTDELPSLIGRSDVAAAGPVPLTDDGEVDWAAMTKRPTMHVPGNEEDVHVLGTATGENTVDVTADVSLAYDDEALYFAADVTDDQHHATAGKGMWQADNIQLAGAADGYGPEIGFSHAEGESHVVRWRAGQARAGPDAIDLETSREGEVTTYRARIPWEALYPETPSAGDAVPFSFLINESDGEGRVGWVEWTPGIGELKSADPLGSIQLSGAETDWRSWITAPRKTSEGSETTLSIVVSNDAAESRTVDVTVDDLGVEATGIEVPASGTVRKPITATYTGLGEHTVSATVSASDGTSTTVENRIDVTANCAEQPERYPSSFTTYGFTLDDDVFLTAWYQWSDRCAPGFPIEPVVELDGLAAEDVRGVTVVDHRSGERTDVPDPAVSTDSGTLRLEGVEMDAPVFYLLIETA
jgi:hypothetical protein